MVEMQAVGPGEAVLRRDGVPAGEARWSMGSLCWPGEQVTVADLAVFSAPAELQADFWAYLRYLWQKEGAAAVRQEGKLSWFSPALQKSWEAAGGVDRAAPPKP